MVRRVTESFASPNEVYPTLEQACYLKYLCAWCQEKYFLVEPETHRAGGGIMHGKILGYETGRCHFMCLSCIQYNKFRERNSGFLI
jgi:hypothetical protein